LLGSAAAVHQVDSRHPYYLPNGGQRTRLSANYRPIWPAIFSRVTQQWSISQIGQKWAHQRAITGDQFRLNDNELCRERPRQESRSPIRGLVGSTRHDEFNGLGYP